MTDTRFLDRVWRSKADDLTRQDIIAYLETSYAMQHVAPAVRQRLIDLARKESHDQQNTSTGRAARKGKRPLQATLST